MFHHGYTDVSDASQKARTGHFCAVDLQPCTCSYMDEIVYLLFVLGVRRAPDVLSLYMHRRAVHVAMNVLNVAVIA
jgi:hypothetical protein